MSSLPPCRRLVVGTDFSPAAAAALRLAAAWATPRRLELLLVHVAPAGLGEAAMADLQGALGELGRSVEELNQGLRCEVELASGPAGRSLERSCGPESWLALGMEGSAADALRRPGRLCDEACRNASLPVLLAPPRWRAPMKGRRAAAPSFQRVLVGLSGGPRDRARLESALELARPGRPSVAHVVDLSWARCYPAAARALAEEPAEKGEEAFLGAFLGLEDELVDVAGDGPELDLQLVRQGPVHADLAGLADSQSAELLLVGSGPTAALLCGLADCPILVLP